MSPLMLFFLLGYAFLIQFACLAAWIGARDGSGSPKSVLGILQRLYRVSRMELWLQQKDRDLSNPNPSARQPCKEGCSSAAISMLPQAHGQ